MRSLPGHVALAAVTVLALTSTLGCGGPLGTGTFATPTYTLSVSPQATSVPVGSKVTFTATTSAPPNQLLWGLVGTNGTSTIPPTDAGSPSVQTGGTAFVYTAPAVPPVYGTNAETAGTVRLSTIAGATMVEQTFVITAPAITTGFYAPASTSVALGATLGINAYAIGDVNNALTLQVNGVTGGSTSVGTIAHSGIFYGQYLYTAPAAMPMTGSAITLTVISQADPSKSSTLTLTLH